MTQRRLAFDWRDAERRALADRLDRLGVRADTALWKLCRMLHEEGGALGEPSARLARRVRCTTRQLRRAARRGVELGLLDVLEQRHVRGGQRPSRYRLVLTPKPQEDHQADIMSAYQEDHQADIMSAPNRNNFMDPRNVEHIDTVPGSANHIGRSPPSEDQKKLGKPPTTIVVELGDIEDCCVRLLRAIGYRQSHGNCRTVWKAAALLHAGRLAESEAASAARGTYLASARSPVGYFRCVLRDLVQRRREPANFDQLVRSVRIEPEWPRRPPAGFSSQRDPGWKSKDTSAQTSNDYDDQQARAELDRQLAQIVMGK